MVINYFTLDFSSSSFGNFQEEIDYSHFVKMLLFKIGNIGQNKIGLIHLTIFFCVSGFELLWRTILTSLSSLKVGLELSYMSQCEESGGPR